MAHSSAARTQEREAQAIPADELRALWTDSRYRLRDRAYRALAYSMAARADELLGLDVEDVDLANREAQIIGKGGDAQRIFLDSEAGRLLARLIGGPHRRPGVPRREAPLARPGPGGL